MDLGLVCPEETGHLNPSLALGRELARRGHRVRFFTAPDAAARIVAAGLEYAPIGEKEADEGFGEWAMERLGRLRGIRGMLFTGRLIVAWSRILERDLPGLIRHDPCEALLIDQVCPGAAMVARRLDLPYLVICNGLAVVMDERTPPVTTTWRFSEHWLPRLRNRWIYRTLPPIVDLISGGGSSGRSSLALCRLDHHGLALLAQQPPGFDPVGREREIYHTGPWHHAERDDDIPFPWERLDGRPLIYASLGTVLNRTSRLFRKIIRAAEGLDVQLVLALGRRDARWTEPLPENVVVVSYAPQLPLLARASVAITHTGMNSALECLAAGVPMLCLPIMNDQPGVARRVETIGAGRLLSPRRATPKRLRAMIEELLGNDQYRAIARRFQAEIARTPGTVLAAEVIEQVLESRR